MRTLYKAALVPAVSAVLLLAPAVSASAPAGAPADAKVHAGKVDLSVYGKGLHVDSVAAATGTQANGTRARLFTSYKGHRKTITKWKYVQFVDAGMTHFSMAQWNLDRSFRNGTWLCAEFTNAPGKPCARIHR
ncbi:hypothetical protein [Streptomyces sp. VRA16 Mangrove soil]|uniref:hypothetical protein n=1 Tax=Streptomyces sp. VRA16 Mangrove soil TaxID=2817434 RepID=UPI001A9F54ED|nr:hypothetical protein [Streptomyces sp. VRA16 Mangrove soil]MBO1329940.1 hypothetical protein [Streptomyces sp. VRA16 Mangrove soil]